MSGRNDGGPAFPRDIYNGDTDQPYDQTTGMTLRDYAAIKFAAAILANPGHHELLHCHFDRTKIALEAADVFIAERSK